MKWLTNQNVLIVTVNSLRNNKIQEEITTSNATYGLSGVYFTSS